MKPDRTLAARQRRITKALSEIGFALPGSLTVRAYRCGKANCRCKREGESPHGPYAFWTRRVDGKTVTRVLSDDELAEYQPLFDNARKLRDLQRELQELTLHLIEEADAQTPRRPRPTKRHKAQAK